MRQLNRIGKAALCLITGLLALAFAGVGTMKVCAEEEDRRTVKIACGVSELLYLDENGEDFGSCKKYLDELAKINNWEYEYVNVKWSEIDKRLEDGTIDILFPLVNAPEYSEVMEISEMMGGYMLPGIFVREGSGYGYDDFPGFDGAKIAVAEHSVNDTALKEFAQVHGFSYEPLYVESRDEMMRMLNDGTVDMAVFGVVTQMPNVKIVSILDVYPYYFAVKKGNSELAEEINKGMRQLMLYQPDLINELYKINLTGQEGNVVAYTAEEYEFIDKSLPVTVGFYEDTAPLAYLDMEGNPSGVYVELLQMVKQATGLNIRLRALDRDEDWRQLIREGGIDFVAGTSNNGTLGSDDYIATDKLTAYKTILITRNDYQMYQEMPRRIALTRARVYWENNLPSRLRDVELVYYTTTRECLLAVKRGEVDATLLNNIEFNYQTKNPRFATLVQWENFCFDAEAVLIASKNIDSVELSVVNKSLHSLSDEEIDEVVNAQINKPYTDITLADYLYQVRYVLLVIGAAIVVALVASGFIYAIRRKQKQALLEKEEKERWQLKIMAALATDYDSIYFVDMDKDYYTYIGIREGIENEFDSMAGQAQGFFGMIRDYIDSYVQEQYQEAIRRQTDKDAVIERFQTEKNFAVRYQVVPNDLHKTYFEMHFVDVSEKKNEHLMVVGFSCVDEAAKEENEHRQALQEAFDAANKANNAKSDFLSRMSHDIRTPMNGIIGMTAIAMAHIEDKERVSDSLDKISAASRHLLGLINEVLDMSKIESGKVNLNEEEFNISDLLNNMLVMIQPQIKQHNHTLQVHVQRIEHEDVIGDSLRIQQVFVNIMGNAVKYTPDNGQICLTVSEKHVHEGKYGCYKFVFEDNGIGMSKEYVEHIFEPFSRAEDVRTSKIQGTGLGMAISRNIVHMMNGEINVESEPGKGSRFTITIFLKLQEKKSDSTEDLQGLRVLVVDDDQLSCETACNILSEIGIESEWALSGQEAVECVRRSRKEGSDYFAILLDWQMPGMDGVKTAKAIRKIKGLETMLVILSAYDWSDVEMEARAAGVDAFLNKPAFKSGFVRLFRRLINGEKEEIVNSELREITECKFPGKKVLLVEDNDLNREIATEILSMTDITVEEAENGKRAVDKFSASAEGYYDIIFMDVQMPVMNGYDATAAIRSLKRRDARRVPIIAMTANAFVEDVEAAKNAGMNEHLSKPLDFDKLAAVLDKYLGGG